jgi:ribosomal protein S3
MQVKQTIRTMMLAGALAIWVSVSGCIGSKVNRTNYDKINTGMKQSEVAEILGNGQKKDSAGAAFGALGVSSEVMNWQDGDRTITVMFVNNLVVVKSQVGL